MKAPAASAPVSFLTVLKRSVTWLVFRALPIRGRLKVLSWLNKRHEPEPVTFCQKLRASVLQKYDPRFEIVADKVRVRDFVQTRVGDRYTVPCVGAYDSPESIPFDSLPERFVAKANHASGWNYFVRDGQNFDRSDLVRETRKWLSTVYGREHEWWYALMPRKILIEPFLEGEDGDLPADYKLFTFRGMVRLVQVDRGRYSDHIRNYYDGSWNSIPEVGMYPRGPEISKPAFFDEMCSLAQKLASDFLFVRLDVYHVAGRTMVGEMTLFPAGGRDPITTPSLDRWLAKWFDHAAEGAEPPPPFTPAVS